MMHHHQVARLIATILAIGGCFWGLFLLPLLVGPLAIAVFGPGYLVTAGYLFQAVSKPPLRVRQVFWLVSFLVQGTWFCVILGGGILQVTAGRHFNEPLLFLAWWAFAAIASAVALLAEGGEIFFDLPIEPDE